MFTYHVVHYTTERSYPTLKTAAAAYGQDTTSPGKTLISRYTYSDGSHDDHVLMNWEAPNL